MHINQMKESKYLKKEDFGQTGKVGTIRGIAHENMAQEGQPPEMKYIIYFNEFQKGMVLNQTNIQLIAMITGQDDTDNWPGHQVTLYEDPTISFGGQIKGGIRVRAAVSQPVQTFTAGDGQQAPVPPIPENGFDDDIPT